MAVPARGNSKHLDLYQASTRIQSAMVALPCSQNKLFQKGKFDDVSCNWLNSLSRNVSLASNAFCVHKRCVSVKPLNV